MLRVFLYLTLFLGFGQYTHAQSVKKLLRRGDRALSKGLVDDAIAYYNHADSLKPGNTEIKLKLGRAYLESDYKHHALPHLTAVYALDPKADPELELYMGLVNQFNYRFQEASEHYQRYLRINSYDEAFIRQKLQECQVGDSLIMNPRAVDVQNLGGLINSPAHDYTPLITANEDMLVFTSRRRNSTGGKKTKDNQYFEDIYVSYQLVNRWSEPQSISKNINSDYHDAAAALSPDGKQIFLYKESGGGDIYTSYLKKGEWTEPESLGAPINSEYFETAVSITADGKTLYFTSDRPEGFGGLDIYKSEKLANGNWGKPENLGPTVNTPYSEDSPFIHPDGNTLYFSSDGHKGLGKYDIFSTELVDGQWQQPQNMGYPINTPDDDINFVISGNKYHAYYTSIREFGIGRADLYSITFLDHKQHKIKQEEERKALLAAAAAKQLAKVEPEPKKEEKKDARKPVAYLSGTVYAYETNMPLPTHLIITNNVTNELIADVYADKQTGEFRVPIYEKGSYAINAESKGYNFYSKNLRIENVGSSAKEVEQDVWMRELSVGAKVILANIFFDSGKSSLRTESLPELLKIKKYLEESPTIFLQINGHTDDVGPAQYNKILSKKRAQSVKDYLVRNGIDPSRLTVEGYGEERPLVSNDDEFDGRAINRRTEIEVVSF